jgi:hypothetical protein
MFRCRKHIPIPWLLVSFICAFLIGGVASARPVLPGGPSHIAGVMTRWQTSSKTACQHSFGGYADEPDCPRSLMFTITPDLDGLRLYDWVAALAAAGVNTGVIYVMPSNRIGIPPLIDQAQFQAYNQDIYLPPASLTASQKQTILQVGLAISKREYSVAQRNYAILVFLQQLQSAFPHSPPISFILDERAWFIKHLNQDGEPVPMALRDVFALEHVYTDDISGIVNIAARQHLDHWLAGVRLSEYAAKDWNLMGPVMVDLATGINANTYGWMAAHSFIGAGGGWGQYWNGIDTMQCPATAGWRVAPCTGAFPFFKYLSPQVGYFAFGDKFMEFGKPQQYMLHGNPSGLKYTYINGEIIDFCAKNSSGYACENANTPTVKDWQVFLDDDMDGLGFSDLVRFMKGNALEYPQLANVVFEGDNSDSIATMSGAKSMNGRRALDILFRHASTSSGSWSGKIFMDGFDDTSTVPRPRFYGDSGYSLLTTNYSDFMFTPPQPQIWLNTHSMAAWSNWP